MQLFILCIIKSFVSLLCFRRTRCGRVAQKERERVSHAAIPVTTIGEDAQRRERGRKHGALRPQRLIRDAEVGGREFLCLTPTRYTVTTRMILRYDGQLCEPF